ncbi:hypothetical protein KKB55_22115 [Myxococcota bacterium]|nr:hypothetical protein [Myxococcota bacterium]
MADEMLVALQRAQADNRPPAEALSPLQRRRVTQDHLLSFIEGYPALFERARDLRDLNRAEIGEADAEAARAWVTLRKGKQAGFDEAALLSVLRFFGFKLDEAPIKDRRPSPQLPFWLTLSARAHIEAPIPRFGSLADGLGGHRFVLVWGEVEARQLAIWLNQQEELSKKEHPLTLLIFKRLNLLDRHHLVHALRNAGYGALIIDDCLIPWIADQDPRRRICALFHVALAGANENPYTPQKAGSVPKEMFFGRHKTLDDLWNLNKSCIVYGGRQLGKSAMLKQLYKNHHNPSKQHWVLWAGVSNDDDIWAVIHRLLRTAQILVHDQILNPKQQKDQIKAFLSEDPQRRILLLFDESDYLLDSDKNNKFEGLNLVRDLMNETDRRFKVVFAGLHGVQRFQNIPNQPLAHFGDPICVGPLEPKDAADLVERPLRALGYRFQSPHLIYRILAHTNCHPSLLQLFCHSLVEEMCKSTRYNRDRILPLTIDEEVIARVDREVELSKRMRLRFDWTLNLDPRYRAIGYTFAWLELMGTLDGERRSGLDAKAVLAEVQEWWPQGFARITPTELEGLLTEMVGLGLLNPHQGRYRLRSPNILRLLGGVEQVMSELEQLETLEADETPYPQVYHRALPGRRDGASPLTWYQEQKISRNHRGLDLIIGSAATRLGEVLPALESLYQDRTALDWSPSQICELPDGRSLLDQIREIYKGRRAHFALSIIIPEPRRFGPLMENLEAILGWFERLSSERRFVRVVCLLDPEALADVDLEALKARGEVLGVHPLSLWRLKGLKHWFSDAEIEPPEDLEAFLEATGGWPSLVAEGLRRLTDGAPDGPRLAETLRPREAQRAATLAASGAMDEPRAALFEALAQAAATAGGGPIEQEAIFEQLAAPRAMLERRLDELTLLNVIELRPQGLVVNPLIFKAWSAL